MGTPGADDKQGADDRLHAADATHGPGQGLRGQRDSDGAGPLEVCLRERDLLAHQLLKLERVDCSAGRGVVVLPQQQSGGLADFGTPTFWRSGAMAIVCVVLAALAAGLTMGLVSLDPMEMDIIIKTEEKDMTIGKDRSKLKEDQEAARKVLPLVRDHHRLLVSLLLLNSIANEALPVFLDEIFPTWLAVTVSVTLVLLFGEIMPSAVFTGSEQLKMASRFAPVVNVCCSLLAPLAVPMARILDLLLGKDHKGRYNFAELRAIVGIHSRLHAGEVTVAVMSHQCPPDSLRFGIIHTDQPHRLTSESVVIFVDGPTQNSKALSTKLRADGTMYYVKPCAPLLGRNKDLTFQLFRSEERCQESLITYEKGELVSGAFQVEERDELKIISGVMNLTHMTAADAMVSLSHVQMLECGEHLDEPTMQMILKCGFSRLPVYHLSKHNVRGFIHVKKLIVVSPCSQEGSGVLVSDIEMQPMVVAPPDIPMLELLNRFQAARVHIGLVTDSPDKVLRAWETGGEMPPDVHMAGIITLEDIIEKIIQEEIEDEHDALVKHKFSKRDFEGECRDGGSRRSAAVDGKARSRLQEPLLGEDHGDASD